MILLRRWQRYLRYLIVVAFIGLMWWLIHRYMLMTEEYYEDYYAFYKGKRTGGNELVRITQHDNRHEDAAWLSNIVRERTQETPMVVIEEHHEVLPYWFQAADLNLLSMSKNTLVHIDAHPDLDIPHTNVWPMLPFFRLPTRHEEIKSMMQKNDVFIAGAILTGLIDHVVWILPDWTTDYFNEWLIGRQSINIEWQAGFFTGKNRDDEITDNKEPLCLCFKLQKGQNQGNVYLSPEWRCKIGQFDFLDIKRGELVKKSKCAIQVSGLLEVMTESHAGKNMKNLQIDGYKRGLILDIDEDFFGTWSDMIDLEKLQMDAIMVDTLSKMIGDLFCAATAFDERIADMFYSALINLVVNLKLQSCEMRGSGFDEQRRRECFSSVEISNLIIEKLPKMLRFLQEIGEIDHIFCQTDQKMRSLYLQTLLTYLQNFSVKQLKHLAWLGICFDVSPSHYSFSSVEELIVCQGSNRPNRTQVQFYFPDEEKLRSMESNFKKIISSLPRKPDLITLCRSVRDGYTPKKLFQTIEVKVIDTLLATFRRIVPENIYYDSNLLSGKLGWPRRFPSWNNKLLKYLSIDVVPVHLMT